MVGGILVEDEMRISMPCKVLGNTVMPRRLVAFCNQPKDQLVDRDGQRGQVPLEGLVGHSLPDVLFQAHLPQHPVIPQIRTTLRSRGERPIRALAGHRQKRDPVLLNPGLERLVLASLDKEANVLKLGNAGRTVRISNAWRVMLPFVIPHNLCIRFREPLLCVEGSFVFHGVYLQQVSL